MSYGFFDCKNQDFGIVEDGILKYYETFERPYLGSIYRTGLGKRLNFIDANEVDLGFDQALIFDRDRLAAGGGQILVQLKSHGYNGKRPMVTEKILIKGKYLIIDPNSSRVNISKKISDVEKRKEIISLFKSSKYGMIVRTGAELHLDLALKEYKDLEEQTDAILASKNFKPCPALVYEPKLDLYDKLGGLDKLYTNDKKIDIGAGRGPVVLYDRTYDSSQDPVLCQSISESKLRQVQVKGAELVIDELEGLTAIDINSKSVRLKANKNENAKLVNYLVLDKLLSQIMFRGIGGIVLIDFIRLDADSMADLISQVEERAKSFYINLLNISYTDSGLMELIIKR